MNQVFRLLLTNSKVKIQDKYLRINILINEETGVIQKTFLRAPNSQQRSEQIFNLKGKFVIPGLVDIHSHLRDFEESSKETLLTGAKAAAAGGYTTVFDMPNKIPPMLNLEDLDRFTKKANKISFITIIPYLMLNSDTNSYLLSNYSFFKAYFGDTTGNYQTTEEDILNFIKAEGKFLSIHAEDNALIELNTKKYNDRVKHHCEIRGPSTETKAINRIITLKNSIKSNSSIHFAHITLKESVISLISNFCSFEATPHHLSLNRDDYERLGTWGKMNPPLRSKKEQHDLWNLYLNAQIPIIATDHAPHTKNEKLEVFLSGIPGLETALAVILNKLKPISEKKMDLIMNTFSLNPRKLMGLSNSSGIQENEIADLTIIDPLKEKTVLADELKTKCEWSPWEGQKLCGWPVLTIHKGHISFNEI